MVTRTSDSSWQSILINSAEPFRTALTLMPSVQSPKIYVKTVVVFMLSTFVVNEAILYRLSQGLNMILFQTFLKYLEATVYTSNGLGQTLILIIMTDKESEERIDPTSLFLKMLEAREVEGCSGMVVQEKMEQHGLRRTWSPAIRTTRPILSPQCLTCSVHLLLTQIVKHILLTFRSRHGGIVQAATLRVSVARKILRVHHA
mmetsp:Transcript_9735/g.13690  ORF Transcript_9735/g.13690 Transcript_9735/m.13690 type:complete len:202 (-) Transcript_9735:1854-2459(-)